MESKPRATIAGVFVVIMVLMLVGTVLWFSQDRTVKMQYDIITERSVNGITPQAAVELYGINVGKVESVSFLSDSSGQVRIRMLIDEKAPVNQATFATLRSRGVTGSVFVELMDDAATPAGQRRLLSEVTLAGQSPTIPLRTGTLEDFADQAIEFFNRADEILSSVNRFLSQENEQILFTTVESFGQAADQITKLGATLDTKAGSVLTAVDSTVQQANATLKNLGDLTQNANAMVLALTKPDGAIESITEGTQILSLAAEHLRFVTLPQVDTAAQSMMRTLRATRRLIEELEDQPQMLIMGAGESKAGPGETGYQSPYSSK